MTTAPPSGLALLAPAPAGTTTGRCHAAPEQQAGVGPPRGDTWRMPAAEQAAVGTAEALAGAQDGLARSIIASAPDGIMLVGRDGRILLANDAMLHISGHTPQALVGQPVEIFLPPELHARHRANMGSSHAGLHARRPMGTVDNLTLLRSDGNSVPVDIALSQCTVQGQATTVVFVRDMTGMKRMEHRMLYQATHDVVTGLFNRWMFNQQLAQALHQAQRQERLLAVLLLDLDDFKSINDGHGHAVGDKVLVEVAKRLRRALRSADTLARLGGDEFIVLLPELSEPADAQDVANKIGKLLAEPCTVDGYEVHLGGSIGIVFYPDDAQDAQTLLRYADMAMYRAKAAGRGTYAVYSASMGRQMEEKVLLHDRLKLALDHAGLRLHYQPQIDVASGAVVGVEALLRWTDDLLGEVPPSRFIPVAESTGLILPLGDWVLGMACRQAALWAEAGHPVRVSVNLSARQFRQPRLADWLGERLAEYGTPPALLELEITESEAMIDPQQTKEQLHKLCALGLGVALDDFGTGHSSLAYLREFPVSRLKIDRAFIALITERDSDATLVRAVLALAKTMQLQVVAEGVEQPAQLAFLQAHGCDYYQGWLFSKAMPAADMTQLLCASAPALQASW
ncbi:MAG TPA: EAL domain-containing protein [Pseudorhodoferax sp.]|nr:EAL domain-containing protein [Pseudorhodoferax sp.]